VGRHVCQRWGPARFLGRPREISGSTTPIEYPISAMKWSRHVSGKKPKRDARLSIIDKAGSCRIMQSVFSVSARRRDALDSTGFNGRAYALKTDWTKPLHDARPMGIEWQAEPGGKAKTLLEGGCIAGDYRLSGQVVGVEILSACAMT
jgi:hypothetical protein